VHHAWVVKHVCLCLPCLPARLSALPAGQRDAVSAGGAFLGAVPADAGRGDGAAGAAGARRRTAVACRVNSHACMHGHTACCLLPRCYPSACLPAVACLILLPACLPALQGEEVGPAFFQALAHVRQIHANCKALLRTHHQRAGGCSWGGSSY
jgi:hypothetical protein